eukprot:3675559-Pleurochrysis_carterae.AAC.1
MTASSAAAWEGWWPNVQPGAVQGSGTCSPGGGMWDRVYRSSAVCEWQALRDSCISEMVAGLDGSLRNAKSRVQPHQPEFERCSECRSAETSRTIYVFVWSST